MKTILAPFKMVIKLVIFLGVIALIIWMIVTGVEPIKEIDKFGKDNWYWVGLITLFVGYLIGYFYGRKPIWKAKKSIKEDKIKEVLKGDK